MAKWTNKQIGTSSRNCQFYIKAVRLDPLFRVSYIVGAVIGFPSERGGAHLEIFSTVYSLFFKNSISREMKGIKEQKLDEVILLWVRSSSNEIQHSPVK